MATSISWALRRSQDRVGKIIVNFIEFHKKCSNEDIFVLPLANLDFRGYVRSGRRVGEVSQTRYACAWNRKKRMRKSKYACANKKDCRKTGTANQYQSVRHYKPRRTNGVVIMLQVVILCLISKVFARENNYVH